MKIHVVMCHSGSYDDYTYSMVKGFLSEEAANAHILVLQAEDELYNQIALTVKAAMAQWDVENPCPERWGSEDAAQWLEAAKLFAENLFVERGLSKEYAEARCHFAPAISPEVKSSYSVDELEIQE